MSARTGYRGGVLFRTWEHEAGAPGVRTVDDRLGRPHTLVNGYRWVRTVLMDPDTYRPDNALDAMTPLGVAALRILARYRFRLPPTLANNGGPSHPAIREATARALHPDRVAAARPWLAGLVAHRVAGLTRRLDAGGDVDLYADLVADLPLLVLARLVELPDSQASIVKEFSRAALELFWAPVPPERQLYLAEIVGRYHRVLRDFAATAGGLVGELRELSGNPDVPVAALFFLLVAGQETTSQFLTLLLHKLCGQSTVDGCVEDVVEEGLRTVPPIVTWRRVAARDTELDGVGIPCGRPVVLWLAGSARPGTRAHLAFGAGAHRCVGAQLARMEAAVVVEATAPMLRDVEVLRAPWSPDNLSFRMPDALVVRRPRATEAAGRPPRPGAAAPDPPRRTVPDSTSPVRRAGTVAG